MHESRPSVIVITGMMAAGKSTIAQKLAENYSLSAHVRGDTFRRMVVGGRAEMTEDPSPAAVAQLNLRYQLSAATADAYAEAGFVAVVQDIILGADLQTYLSSIRTTPLHLVVLAPRTDVVADRERGRHKSGYGPDWTPESLAPHLWERTPRIGLWLDTSDQSPDATVAELLSRLPEARVA